MVWLRKGGSSNTVSAQDGGISEEGAGRESGERGLSQGGSYVYERLDSVRAGFWFWCVVAAGE